MPIPVRPDTESVLDLLERDAYAHGYEVHNELWNAGVNFWAGSRPANTRRNATVTLYGAEDEARVVVYDGYAEVGRVELRMSLVTTANIAYFVAEAIRP